ncbi:ABC transporter permease [Sulfitobacter sp. SK011]|uniref:ABC transporter permease n=1 Tax=Sulfitobacter sp. SK011 TaxID=1389004 RepID=UPI000E0A1296|nr:ABC transporter permease [Sulfitobacter sp. SK011]AXI40669.1 ABC transporter permease [Sulfitobacter sp. SK011]
MFQSRRKPTGSFASAAAMAELIYHSVVRSVRKQHNNAFVAIFMNMMQAVMFVGAFYIMFSVLGLRRSAVRGDFLIYIMSGIFLYMTHSKAVGAVSGSEGPASPMMQHAPMTTVIAITSAAMGALYIQVLSLCVILAAYHVAFAPLQIEQPIAAFGMLLIAWFTGCALGMVLLALKPWFPTFVGLFSTIYQRANMIASGKMFLANTLPSFMLAMFDWNPLFHAIDQARGFAFINYNPRYSNWEYPLWVGLVLLMIGLMGEFYTRKHASISWNARR